MSEPFLGEIRMWTGNFAPRGWAFCHGQIMSIAQDTALFSLLGTTYGGNGQTTFALPDLRGRVPVHQGPGFALGQVGGSESVTLNVSQVPGHSHAPQAQTARGAASSPAGAFWATSELDEFSNAAPGPQLNPGAVSQTGGNGPHNNMMPFLTLNFIIAIEGIYPSRP
jgi:microcystin-dependent protein